MPKSSHVNLFGDMFRYSFGVETGPLKSNSGVSITSPEAPNAISILSKHGNEFGSQTLSGSEILMVPLQVLPLTQSRIV